MAAPFGVTTSGLSLELNGLFWDPFPSPSTTFLLDGLAITTFGFIANSANNWFPPYATYSTVWNGCTHCC